MNTQMATLTKNSQITYFVVFMAFINMMYIQFSFIVFAYMTMVRKKIKSTLSIITATFSIIRIFFSRTFKRMKSNLFANQRAIFGCIFSRFFVFESFSANFANFLNFSVPFATGFFPTFSRTKMNSTRFLFGDITRSFKKWDFAIFADKFNFLISRLFITRSRAKLCSPFYNQILTYGTSFHMPIIPLAVANVNKQNQMSEVPNG